MVEKLDIGGMENGVVNIANYIDDSIFRCFICCFADAGPLAERLTIPDAHRIVLGYNAGFHLESIFRLAQLFHRLRVDIVHTHGWGARSFVAFLGAKLARTPVCINGEHGVLHIEGSAQRIAQKMMGRIVDGTLSVSENLKKKAVAKLGLHPDTITVIPNGVDTHKFRGNYDIGDLYEEIKVNKNDFLLGIIGTLKSQKNQSVAIKAMRELKHCYKKANLLLIGDGPDRDRLKALAQQLGVDDCIRFLGYRDDIPQLLTILDALALCSIQDHEGMSNVILEAMASGVPVISSRSVGTEELIIDGSTGFLFDHSDATQLADCLQHLITSPELSASICDSAREKILKDHTIEVMVGRYQNYYTKMIKNDFF